eukprot:c16383_g1_i2.p1 GENE.c16383_g1_i2~~c16383_g1_i2.p1  ORF type:complete len:163 (+),score=28.27 c16383_g1_i2:1-489(+)
MGEEPKHETQNMLSAKRSFDAMELSSSSSSPPGQTSESALPCSPHRISFLDAPPAFKRPRILTPIPRGSGSHSSPFRNRPSDVDPQAIDELIPKKKSDDRAYTRAEVNEITLRAVQEMESQLRELYDKALQERLAEQFESFSRFNDDYLSRRLRSSNFDYMS